MSKKVMTLAIFLSLIAGGGIISVLDVNENAYYCESTNQICIGTRLSSSGKTCYYVENGTEHGKRCLTEPYWAEYEGTEPEPFEEIWTVADGRTWRCPIDNGEIDSYTRCFSDGREAYLGEKI